MSEDSDELRKLIARLGVSQREAARLLEIDQRELRRMCAAGRAVPRAIMLAMQELVREHEGGGE